MPKYDAQGLLTAVVTNASTDEVLMVAFMDEEALAATRRVGRSAFPFAITRQAVEEG